MSSPRKNHTGARSLTPLVALLGISACTGTISDPGGGRPAACQGTGLPFFDNCAAPPPPGKGCTNPILTPSPTQLPGGPPPAGQPTTFESEIAAAADRFGNKFVATIQALEAPDNTGIPSCVVQKGVRVFRQDAGKSAWQELTTGPILHVDFNPDPKAVKPNWATDPFLATDDNGVLYLSTLRDIGAPNCQTPPPGVPLAADTDSEVQLWVAAPGQAMTQVVKGTTGASLISAGLNSANPRTAGPETVELDHPRLAVQSVSRTETRVVVTFLEAFAKAPQPDHFATVDCVGTNTATPTCTLVGRQGLQVANFAFPQPVFAPGGDLLIAHTGGSLGTSPIIERYSFAGGATPWTFVGATSPTVVTLFSNKTNGLSLPGAPLGLAIPMDPTPGISIAKLGNVSDPAIFLAWTECGPGGCGNSQPRVAFAASSLQHFGTWTPTVTLPPTNSVGAPVLRWAPQIHTQGDANVMDISSFVAVPATPAQQTQLAPEIFRVVPSTGALVTNVLATQNAVQLRDVPRRMPEEGFLFPGEYVGVPGSGAAAFVAWGERSQPATSSTVATAELGVATVTQSCATTRSLSGTAVSLLPDTIWDCQCSCGGFSSQLLGCAPTGVSAATACATVCQGSDCGESLSCETSEVDRSCASTGKGTARMVACRAEFVSHFGAPPSLFGDFYAEASSTATAAINLGSDSANTHLGGSIAINVPDFAPQAGSEIEIARLELRPTSFHLGGLIGATIRNIQLLHVERLHGVFLNSTDFQIPAFGAEFVAQFDVDPDGPSFLTGDTATQRFIASNNQTVTGTLDFGTGQVQLHMVAGSGSQTIDATFVGAARATPTDTDGDGIPDSVDDCPLVANPTQVPVPPVMSSAPDLTLECAKSGLVFSPPSATDVCTGGAVTIEGVVQSFNGQPLSPPVSLANNTAVLAPGATVIEWAAIDGAGDVSTELQNVNVVDTTPPTITAPPGVQVALCHPEDVNVGIAQASDTCSAVTITGHVVSRNGVTLNPPLNVAAGHVTLGQGTYVVQWTAFDGINTSSATQPVTVNDPLFQNVRQLANGNMQYSITFPQTQAYVEAFVRQNGVQNISGNIVSSRVANADGTFTYSRVAPASTYHTGDVISVRFYSYRSGMPGVFTPGPAETLWFPDFIYGFGTDCQDGGCHPTFTQRPNGSVTFSETFTVQQSYVEAFIRRNGSQIAAGNIVSPGIRNLDGTFSYVHLLPASTFTAGDHVDYRFYSYISGQPGVFQPGPTSSTWFPAFTFGQPPTTDCHGP
jgi:hypothetical protein